MEETYNRRFSDEIDGIIVSCWTPGDWFLVQACWSVSLPSAVFLACMLTSSKSMDDDPTGLEYLVQRAGNYVPAFIELAQGRLERALSMAILGRLP